MRNEATFFPDDYIADFFGSKAFDKVPKMLGRTVSVVSDSPKDSKDSAGVVIITLPLLLSSQDLPVPSTYSIFSDHVP